MKGSQVGHWLLSLALVAAATAAQALEVRDVRLWRAPDHTRIVFDLSGPTTHKRLVLSQPARVAIDIDNTRLATDLAKIGKRLANTPVRSIRHAVHNGNDLRVVFDLRESVRPNSFLLKPHKQFGDRLVIDLYDTGPSGQGDRPSVKKSVKDLPKRDIVIAIDAGHGGEDPGASGPGGLREKVVVLAIAKDLHRLLEKDEGFKPRLVRTGDYYIGLKKRRDIARQAQADLLVSVHADAFKDAKARGSSVYALSQRGASSAFAGFLAKRENAADLVGGVSLDDKEDLLSEVLYDMSLTNTLDASLGLGDKVLRQMGHISKLHRQQVEQATFMVLKSPDIPSILVETGFISNPQEADRLRTRQYQRKMARAIHNGIRAWFVEHPPADTLVAWWRTQGGREYVIAPGDTLSEIAQKFNVSVSALRTRNALTSNTIRVGQKLIIPAS